MADAEPNSEPAERLNGGFGRHAYGCPPKRVERGRKIPRAHRTTLRRTSTRGEEDGRTAPWNSATHPITVRPPSADARSTGQNAADLRGFPRSMWPDAARACVLGARLRTRSSGERRVSRRARHRHFTGTSPALHRHFTSTSHQHATPARHRHVAGQLVREPGGLSRTAAASFQQGTVQRTRPARPVPESSPSARSDRRCRPRSC